jgi:hypothetical protein
MLQIRTSSGLDGRTTTRRIVPIRTALLALVAAAAVSLTLPLAASAAAKPTRGERLKAKSTCVKERGKSKAKRNAFRVTYGVGKQKKRALRRCTTIHARSLARKRAARRPAGPVAPAPPLFPELPGVRADCQIEQMEDPLGFAQEYPGANPLELCVQMESMP